MPGCPNCGFTSDPETGAMYDTTFPCPECREGGAVVQEGCQNCGSNAGWDRTYMRCSDCGEPYEAGSLGLHWMTKTPPPPEFFDRFQASEAPPAQVLEVFDEPDAEGNVGLTECPVCQATVPFPDDSQDDLLCSCGTWFQVTWFQVDEADSDPLVRIAAKYKSKKKVKPKGGKGKEFTVYEYSDAQIANRNKAKAKRYEKLGKSIGELRTKVKKDIKSEDPETMLTALAVALIDETFERVGNEGSADDGHFGVTGWQRKHVKFGKDGATITYVGKSGVKHVKKVKDPIVKRALRDAYEAADKDDANLFTWEGGSVTAEKVNAYLKPFKVTAKDIRGYHANREMTERLQAARKGKLPEDKKERKKKLKDEFLKALDETAEAVGHEASTLRSQYLVPGMEDQYLKDGTVMSKMGSVKINAGFLRIVERYLDEVSQASFLF